MDYKQRTCIKPDMATTLVHRKPELLQQLDSENPQNLFSINTAHSVFDLCTRGHAVLNHSLCPASMYFELAARAANLATHSTHNERVPHIQELEISSPLSTSPSGSVFLRLAKVEDRYETWRFSIFSRSPPDATVTTHASGIVALLAQQAAGETGEFQSLKRLVRNTLCEHVINASDANGLNGAILYKNFGRVVDYAAYYRGVKRVLAKDLEAVGHVVVPEEQPLELELGCCDPVAIDNFLQVSGIHINCLWDCNDGEVFVCTAIRDLSFSQFFLDRPNEKRSWTVYSNSEPRSKGQVVNDIFVLDSDTGELVLTLLGAKFISLPFRSLSRTLSKLNDFQEHGSLRRGKERYDANSSLDDIYQHEDVSTLISRDNSVTSDTIADTDDPGHNQDPVLEKLQEMLSVLLEVPINDVQPHSTLGDLGVDSLMTTEVMSEIKARFGVEISITEFRELTDIQSLCCRIQPPASEKLPRPHSLQDSRNQDDCQTACRMQTTSEEGPVTYTDGPGTAIALVGNDCFQGAKNGFDTVAETTGFLGFSRDVYPLQKELVVAYVVEAFAALDCPLAMFESGQRLPNIRYSSKHTKVVSQYYHILEDANLVTRTERGFCRTSGKVPQQPAQSLHNTVIAKFPQHVSEHRLLQATGPKLANCLAGRDDPIALLFGNATARELMTDVYTNAPIFKAGTLVLSQYLSDVFRKVDGDHEIRILELGAGTGGTTSYLVDSLARCRQRFRYTFTDLSSSLVAAAKKKFAKYSCMEYTTLDVEQEHSRQHLGRYDIILSTNCIHATENLVTSTTNIRKMLQPDGLLCLVELTRNLFWFDLVFGLLEGWWLFSDGRKHALASEHLWEHNLHQAGFHWVDWSRNQSPESRILRVIVASPSKALPSVRQASLNGPETQETVAFKRVGDTDLLADIYYPERPDSVDMIRPIALMIHGGGHVMLSRKDVRPQQTRTLLEAGFLPISIDYRLCPETTLIDGPMRDVCSALDWARRSLSSLCLKRDDIRPDGDRVVAVGWSTGGHLAMTLAWTAPAAGVVAPNAILAFYCPTDYEDPYWSQPNVPRGSEHKANEASFDLLEGVRDSAITAYNPPASARALGGWMAPEDPRSRICLHMNWKGQALPILLGGLKPLQRSQRRDSHAKDLDISLPTEERIIAVSPLAQIRRGVYLTPTFLVHGTRDDLIPWEQTQRTYDALAERGIHAEARIVKDGIHLFDMSNSYRQDEQSAKAVDDGYRFLQRFARLM
ncbi:MAG: hypothetical protein Q9188_000982 [Gyalolechia gomerana]